MSQRKDEKHRSPQRVIMSKFSSAQDDTRKKRKQHQPPIHMSYTQPSQEVLLEEPNDSYTSWSSKKSKAKTRQMTEEQDVSEPAPIAKRQSLDRIPQEWDRDYLNLPTFGKRQRSISAPPANKLVPDAEFADNKRSTLRRSIPIDNVNEYESENDTSLLNIKDYDELKYDEETYNTSIPLKIVRSGSKSCLKESSYYNPFDQFPTRPPINPINNINTKKVSILPKSYEKTEQLAKQTTGQIGRRFQSEQMAEESDTSITSSISKISVKKTRRSRSPEKLQYASRGKELSPSPREPQLFGDKKSEDDFKNRNTFVEAGGSISYESLGAESSCSMPRDAVPLQIEIPDVITDVDAFRRYLSNSRPSNDTLERRSRKRSGSGTNRSQTRYLGHDASRRTASLFHAIMTLALLASSICQLRFFNSYSSVHPYPAIIYCFIFTSLALEVLSGIGFVVVARCHFDESQSETIHNYLMIGLFIVAISNVVLASFAFDGHLCDGIKSAELQNAVPTQRQNEQINPPIPKSDRLMDLRYMPLE